MKTMLDITSEHIARNENLARMMPEDQASIRDAVARQNRRVENDPAVKNLIHYFARGLTAAVQGNLNAPPGMLAQMISGTMLQVVMEWEDINLEFDKQLQPENQRSENQS